MEIIRYKIPDHWIKYRLQEISGELIAAKSAVLSLIHMPYQKEWIESLQQIEFKREISGTSKIEGAEFTERELDLALKETQEQLFTRSQKQAHAAAKAYRWIASLPTDYPAGKSLILEIHQKIVQDADDDHCPPGVIRQKDQNVTFGSPPHRGVDGGGDCERTFNLFVEAMENEFPKHEVLVQALAAHYHVAAMHPFLDGNGRTARALEAFLLRRAGLKDSFFISMSNYYYDEKREYLAALSDVRSKDNDLTLFLKFGLKGIELQIQRFLSVVRKENSKVLFRDMAHRLFGSLVSKRKSVIGKRQLEILDILLKEENGLDLLELLKLSASHYRNLKYRGKALYRDLDHLRNLGAIKYHPQPENVFVQIDLDWPTKITHTQFYSWVKDLEKRKSLIPRKIV